MVMARDAHGCIATDCGVALVQALGIHCDENEHASMLPGVWLNSGSIWSCVNLHLFFAILIAVARFKSIHCGRWSKASLDL